MLSKISVLDSKIDLLDTQIDSSCAPTPISSATTITASGPYCLAQDIQGTITINADKVTLDLNCFEISNASYGVVITNDHSDVTIKNGTIGGGSTTSQVGISVASGCARISIKNVTIVDCELVALDFSGSASSSIETIDIVNSCIENSGIGLQTDNVLSGLIKYCCISQNITGIFLNKSEKIVIGECSSFSNERAGFELKLSSNNRFNGCRAFDNGEIGSDNAFGFIASDGSNNTFQNCHVQNTKTNATSGSKMAAGFALIGTEQKSVIADCSCKKTQAVSGGSSQAKIFGIYIAGTAQKCVVRNALISGTTGGAGGIGCEADGSANLIISNIGYENDTNFGTGVTNVHSSGLAVDPKALDNLFFPPL